MTVDDLFSYSARTSDPATSHEAATVDPASRTRPRVLVLEVLAMMGEATDYAISVHTGILRGTVAKRRGECVEAGWVEKAGRGRTDTGAAANTWRLTTAGRIHLEGVRRGRHA